MVTAIAFSSFIPWQTLTSLRGEPFKPSAEFIKFFPRKAGQWIKEFVALMFCPLREDWYNRVKRLQETVTATVERNLLFFRRRLITGSSDSAFLTGIRQAIRGNQPRCGMRYAASLIQETDSALKNSSTLISNKRWWSLLFSTENNTNRNGATRRRLETSIRSAHRNCTSSLGKRSITTLVPSRKSCAFRG